MKINLLINITGRKNGLHLLQSLCVMGGESDEISIKPSDRLKFTADGFDVDDQNFSVKKAYEFFVKKTSIKTSITPTMNMQCEINLKKRIPVCAGLGGGSSDASASIKALCQFFNQDFKEQYIYESGEIGCDVPLCTLHQINNKKYFWVEGSGKEKITSLDLDIKLNALIVNPKIKVHTKDVFEFYKKETNGFDEKIILPEIKTFENLMDFLSKTRNTLEEFCIKMYSELKDLRYLINTTKPDILRMSGTGPTFCAIYENNVKMMNAFELLSNNRHLRIYFL